MAVFRRKQNRKNKKAKILCHDKDFGFLCFLMQMPLNFLFSESMLSRVQPRKQAAQRAEQHQTDNEIADAVGHVKEQT